MAKPGNRVDPVSLIASNYRLMHNQLIESISARSTGAALACFGASHGYRFEGDTVHLNAMFTVLNPDAHDCTWALQLWACPVVPANAGEISGQLVAQVALPPIGEIADDAEHFETSAPAIPPAGNGEHVMVLALVAGRGREARAVQDWFAYARRESFAQPRLNGNVGFRIEGSRVILDLDRIENPRTEMNVSGTLALELWGLKDRYCGGSLTGVALAGVAFGPLSGQCESTLKSFDLPYTPPPAGAWNVALMLREWTPAGFVTRDFVNFATPLVIAEAKAAPAHVAPEPKPTVVEPKKPVARGVAKSVAVATKRPAPVSTVKKISVNTATAQELRSIKGLPAKVADGIVKKRPFKSLGDLLNVKGMGAKLLAKVRSRLKL